MINSIGIKNFKSIVDLSLEIGTFNVLIGENGCGKSNILEAIAFGAAASADKLDFEFLGSRGIRVTNPEFMYSAFADIKRNEIVRLDFKIDGETHFFDLTSHSDNPKKWIDKTKTEYFQRLTDSMQQLKDWRTQTHDLSNLNNQVADVEKKEKNKIEIDNINSKIPELNNTIVQLLNKIENISLRPDLANYVIYSPEQSSLRKFEETAQIYPIGIKGEGLFQYLKELASDKKSISEIDNIKKTLFYLDWYEDFKLPESSIQNEFSIDIKDKYLNEDIKYFDQRSTNEGFLYLLLYSTIFVSKLTPPFFAIDNIDVSFNPKLCSQLVRSLSKLAKMHNKQVIVTTHNPAILDGLNLKDNDQRLFVIRRNEEGHTQATRVEYKEERNIKLSEAWTRGYIGGLPDNF